MRMNKLNSSENTFRELLVQFQQTRQKVFAQANTSLMELYWHIGQSKQLSALARVLPWTHNTTIFSRCKSHEERRFYLALCQQEKYSSRELERQINAASFERASLSPPKLSAAMRVLQPAVGEAFKDHYVLEFLGLPEPHSENDLKRAMVRHMKAFVLELGKDFLFINEELKEPHENPSMGVLLCRDKDDEVVEYALSRNLSPTLVAQYQLQLPDKKLLQSKLHELLMQEWGGEV